MLELIATALQNQDYSTAQHLITQGHQDDPNNPWLLFYEARLAEATDHRDRAAAIYRALLPQVVNPKLIAQVRQGLQRIETFAHEKQVREQAHEPAHEQQAIAPTTPQAVREHIQAQCEHQDLVVLILEPISPGQKKAIAQKFAQIMAISVYEATLKLPTRAWRIYRTGAFNSLEWDAQRLNLANINCFCCAIAALKPIRVYSVLYLEALSPQFTVICQTEQGQERRLSFASSDLRRQIEAHVPLLDNIVTYGLRGELERKTDIMDYAKFCDFHLPQYRTILRFCDQTYQFNQGVTAGLSQAVLSGQGTTKNQWQDLQQIFRDQLPLIPRWSNLSEFTIFSESAIEYPDMLAEIDPQIDLLRREDTAWDAAFHLYSCLIGYRQDFWND